LCFSGLSPSPVAFFLPAKYAVARIRRRTGAEFVEDYPLSGLVPLVHLGLDEPSLVSDLSVRNRESVQEFVSGFIYHPKFIVTREIRTYAIKRSCRTDADSGIRPLLNYPVRFVAACPAAIRECYRRH